MVVRRHHATAGDAWDFPADFHEFDADRWETGREWINARRALMPSPSSGEISGGRWLILLQDHYRLGRELRAADLW
jgi:hypothetical protein